MFPLHNPLDDTLREELAAYDDLTAALLARRGILTKEDAEKFLNPSYDEHLHDPLLMIDMEKAARRLGVAILSGEKIAIWSDYDCDGIPGAVVLHDFLKKVGANFENYIPHRHDEGFGMNTGGIEALAKNGAKLIVTIDSGITDVEPIARAKELGIEVIVTDHHLSRLAESSGEGGPNGELPDAYAIVNPNARADEKYPFRELCGASIAWKLVCAIFALSPEIRERVPAGWEKWLLDMVGLATIADMVPLTGENRVLATYGLKVLRKSPRIGLQKLCRVIRTDQRALTEDDIGFMLAPRINAASRMGDARDALRIFTTNDENEAEMLANKLEKANRQRKAEAGALTRAVHARLKERTTEVRSIIALGDPAWRPALLGLVAGGIADEYERPVFLWGRDGNGSIKGSMRSGGSVHALELMRAAEDTFVEFGGHSKAGGFTVRDDAIFFLEDKLVEAYARLETRAVDDDLSKHADAVITVGEATESFLKKVELLSPFGMQNPKPVFLVREVLVREISRFGKGQEHLKLKISTDEERGSIDAVTFFAKGALARTVGTLTLNSSASILVHLERDTFSRGNPVRLRLLDIRV
jgi:single-stranded-DNA-specific exonuclease